MIIKVATFAKELPLFIYKDTPEVLKRHHQGNKGIYYSNDESSKPHISFIVNKKKMLHGNPTKNGTGISLFGDYGDLNTLYTTVHEIANSLDESNERSMAQHQLLMSFAYDIRKAFLGQRLEHKHTFEGDDKVLFYYGFQIVWTDMLIFISALRHNAGYIQTDKRQQANLYMLEDVVERAMVAYDPEGATKIQQLIGQRIDITNKYAFLIFQALHIKFVSEPSGIKRFRNIPLIVGNHFSEWKKEYKDMIASLEISAREKNCQITDLGFDDFPEIKW